MNEEIYEKLASKSLIKHYPCDREEYFSIPKYLRSHCTESSNVYYRYKEMEDYELITIALQLEQIEQNKSIIDETSSAASSLKFFQLLTLIGIVIIVIIRLKTGL